MHYYQLNIADYRKDTQHLTPIEHYIYRELIDWYYLDESPIPKKTQWVLRRLRLVSENNQDLINVLNEFFIDTAEGWEHNRIKAEIAKYHAKADTARSNGSKGGRPKKPRKTKVVNLANPEITQRKANHKPITINHKPIKRIEFDLFYSEYPLKKSKQPAIKIWDKLNDKERQSAINGISVYISSITDKKYIKHPSTYLNQRVWEDAENISSYDPMKDPKNAKRVAEGEIYTEGYGWSI